MTFQIPSNVSQSGTNSISLTVVTPVVLVQSATVNPTLPVLITANFYWSCVFQGYVQQDGSEGQAISIQSGTSNSDTETFAETIGIEFDASEGVPFDDISEKLNASFSATQSYQTSITVSESETTTVNLSVQPPSGSPGVTFQFWQICFIFEANGQSITELLNDNIIMTEFVDGSSDS